MITERYAGLHTQKILHPGDNGIAMNVNTRTDIEDVDYRSNEYGERAVGKSFAWTNSKAYDLGTRNF